MPFQDLANKHPTAAEIAQVDNLFTQVEAIFAQYMRNLTPAENKRYGSIKENRKLLVNKVMDYHQSQPALQSPDVDWAEFDRDHTTRMHYERTVNRFLALAKIMTETRRLHDHDNLANAMIDYEYAKYKMRTEPGAGYDSKVQELQKFFAKRGPSTLSDGTDSL